MATEREEIRHVVESAKASGLDINDRNIVDLVLDNVMSLTGVEDARRAIRAAGYSVAGLAPLSKTCARCDELEGLLKLLVIAWDADQDEEFADALAKARQSLGFKLA